MDIRMALSIISGRVDPDSLEDYQAGSGQGWYCRGDPRPPKDKIIEQAEDVVAALLEKVQETLR